MKRFHVHMAVKDLAKSVRFYSTLFAAEPSVIKEDYAKWMLEDPRVNFAISNRGHAEGVNHLGFQVDSGEELVSLKDQLRSADAALVEQSAEACCYAKSDKYWVTDPAGVAWETFHTLSSVPVYGEDTHLSAEPAACCVPVKAEASEPCCVSAETTKKSSCCAA
jgi:catechol 2,3-dioxygenase-like lactoylglutathione lyase family enzyme